MPPPLRVHELGAVLRWYPNSAFNGGVRRRCVVLRLIYQPSYNTDMRKHQANQEGHNMSDTGNTVLCVVCDHREPEATGEYFTVQSPTCHKDPRDPAADFGEIFACVDCRHGLADELGVELDDYDRANSNVRVVKHGPNSAGPGGAITDVTLYMRPDDADDADKYATERRTFRVVYQPGGRRLVREYHEGNGGVTVRAASCGPTRWVGYSA